MKGYLIHFSWADADRDPPKMKRWTFFWAKDEDALARKVSQLYRSKTWRSLVGEYGSDFWSKRLIKIYQISVQKVKV